MILKMLVGLGVVLLAWFVLDEGIKNSNWVTGWSSSSRVQVANVYAEGTITTIVTEVDADGKKTITMRREDCGGEGGEGDKHSNWVSKVFQSSCGIQMSITEVYEDGTKITMSVKGGGGDIEWLKVEGPERRERMRKLLEETEQKNEEMAAKMRKKFEGRFYK